MKGITSRRACHALLLGGSSALFAALAFLIAPEGLALAAAGTALLMAFVFATVWSVARLGGTVLSGTATVLFGLCMLDALSCLSLHPLAGAQALGYLAGVLWAGAVTVCDLMGELRILNLCRGNKMY